MKVSNDCINKVILPAIQANCIKQDKNAMEPVNLAATNVFHYINRLNKELLPDQTIYGIMNLSDMLLPSGLAALLMPRRIQFDINNRLQPNLRHIYTYTSEEVMCYKPVQKTEKFMDGDKEKTRVVTNWEEDVNYSYSDFIRDLTKIRVAMRVNDLELNTSVAQAVRDVDVLSIVDRIEYEGRVKWNGSTGSEFIPIKLISGFNIGLNYDEYVIDTEEMLESKFNTSVKQCLTK